MFAKALSIVLLVLAAAAHAQGVGDQLVSRITAQRHGLSLAWFTQVAVDPTFGHVSFITQHQDLLLVQTSDAIVHAIDTETGRTIWAVQIGQRGLLNLGVGANEKYVAVVNGSQLYIVDRKNGQLVWDQELKSSPGAGAALSSDRVFVPMVGGLVQAYMLDDPRAPPWNYQSAGRILLPCIVTPLTVSWTTSRGHFYVADVREAKIRLRLETGASIEAQPAYWSPRLFATSLDGFIYAIDEKTGQTEWKFAVGEPMSEPPVAIGTSVYASSSHGGLYQLDAITGKPRWFAPAISRFLSLSPTRVYAVDNQNHVVILDVRSGARLDAFPIGTLSIRFNNSRTDRIYLGTRTGRLQCLHETQLVKPVVYESPIPESLRKESAEKAAPQPPTAPPPTAAPPADAPDELPADAPAEKPPAAAEKGEEPTVDNPFDQ